MPAVEAKNKPGQPEELKPATLIDVLARFSREEMDFVGRLTKNQFLQGGHQAMLGLAAYELLGNVTAPQTFLLKPEEQKAIEAQLKEAVNITDGHAGQSMEGGFLKTEKDSARLLKVANYVNELAGTGPKVLNDKSLVVQAKSVRAVNPYVKFLSTCPSGDGGFVTPDPGETLNDLRVGLETAARVTGRSFKKLRPYSFGGEGKIIFQVR